MKSNLSGGLLMLRYRDAGPEFFLVHLGGPWFSKRDRGAWTIPKGLPLPGEDLLNTAIREFIEETGITPSGPYYDLGSIKQKSGKTVKAWAFVGDWDPQSGIKCNTFTMEWPPRSGKEASFPEVDRAAWMDMAAAREAIIAEQVPLLERARDVVTSTTHASKNENHPPSA